MDALKFGSQVGAVQDLLDSLMHFQPKITEIQDNQFLQLI